MHLQLESEDYNSDLIDIYIGTFSRAPDPEGLQYWQGLYDTDALNFAEIASNFMLSPEAQERFPGGVNNAELIYLVYDNLFDRNPDTSGFEYWLDVMDRGLVTRELSIATIIGGARAETGNPNDRAVFNARAAQASDYMIEVALGHSAFDMSAAENAVLDILREDVANPALEPTDLMPDMMAQAAVADNLMVMRSVDELFQDSLSEDGASSFEWEGEVDNASTLAAAEQDDSIQLLGTQVMADDLFIFA